MAIRKIIPPRQFIGKCPNSRCSCAQFQDHRLVGCPLQVLKMKTPIDKCCNFQNCKFVYTAPIDAKQNHKFYNIDNPLYASIFLV